MKNLFILFLFFIPQFVTAQEQDSSLVNWIDIETADSLFKKQPKPMLIDVYTDWCGWCKYMMKTTYSNPNIAGYINTNFYPVKLNAEKVDTISFNGKTYDMQGKTNKLALILMNNRAAYPTTVFYTADRKHIPIPGYKSVTEFEPYLVYFAENLTYTDINQFIISYYFTFPENHQTIISKTPDNQKPDTSGTTKWIDIETAVKNNKTLKRKYFIFLDLDWYFSCKVMKKITFSNPVIADILNTKYNAICFNTISQDTIKIMDKTYLPTGKNMPHQLTMAIMQGKYFFPSVAILDKNFNLITIIPYYLTAENLEPILEFYASDAWKTESFEEFSKTFVPKTKH